MIKSGRFQTNYVLIDFENVQPKNLSLLKDTHFKIYLFLGAKQTRIDVDLAAAMHKFGPARAKYITVSETRPNALDFHMTYYLGRLAAQDISAYFHIISKDKGFDPLINHMKANEIKVERRDRLSDIPITTAHVNDPMDDKFKALVKNLSGRGQSKPRTIKTLKNTMRTIFKDELNEADVTALFDKLTTSKYVISKDNKISYSLPA